jgi:2-amino-4-hydroxy-6-hydroxymethyldihydropteridine diphosphokinase
VALVGLGSNLGDSIVILGRAYDALASLPGTWLDAVSRTYLSRPVGGPPDQRIYFNAAARLRTRLSPEALLQELLRIERMAGRTRTIRWGPRYLDLDLLLYDDLVLDSADLTVPHPRLAERRFALEPLAEIASESRHPKLGATIAELARRLRDEPEQRDAVTALQEVSAR